MEKQININIADKQKLADALIKQFKEGLWPGLSIQQFIKKLIDLKLNEFVNLSELGVIEEI